MREWAKKTGSSIHVSPSLCPCSRPQKIIIQALLRDSCGWWLTSALVTLLRPGLSSSSHHWGKVRAPWEESTWVCKDPHRERKWYARHSGSATLWPESHLSPYPCPHPILSSNARAHSSLVNFPQCCNHSFISYWSILCQDLIREAWDHYGINFKLT